MADTATATTPASASKKLFKPLEKAKSSTPPIKKKAQATSSPTTNTSDAPSKKAISESTSKGQQQGDSAAKAPSAKKIFKPLSADHDKTTANASPSLGKSARALTSSIPDADIPETPIKKPKSAKKSVKKVAPQPEPELESEPEPEPELEEELEQDDDDEEEDEDVNQNGVEEHEEGLDDDENEEGDPEEDEAEQDEGAEEEEESEAEEINSALPDSENVITSAPTTEEFTKKMRNPSEGLTNNAKSAMSQSSGRVGKASAFAKDVTSKSPGSEQVSRADSTKGVADKASGALNGAAEQTKRAGRKANQVSKSASDKAPSAFSGTPEIGDEAAGKRHEALAKEKGATNASKEQASGALEAPKGKMQGTAGGVKSKAQSGLGDSVNKTDDGTGKATEAGRESSRKGKGMLQDVKNKADSGAANGLAGSESLDEAKDVRPTNGSELPLFELAKGLIGNTVDESGNVVSSTGEAVGRVSGDLPSMVGKTITSSGEVMDDNDEVAGQVSENYARSKLEDGGEIQGTVSSIQEGKLLDEDGEVIGRTRGNFSGKAKGSFKSKELDAKAKKDLGSLGQLEESDGTASQGSPSDIYLDVKSTNEGISLTIRIPTGIFKGNPTVSINDSEK